MVAISKNKRGFVLLTTILIMALLILLGAYLVTFTLTELKIADSQSIASKTYYLAESGIAEAIWKIKNDPTWKENFETNAAWSITYTRNPAIYNNGSYQIQITNTGLARGEITATGFLTTGNRTTQRVVKTMVYKALGQSPIEDYAEVADGNVDLSGSVLNVHGGSLIANNNLIVNYYSAINADNRVTAAGNIVKHWTSAINATEIIENGESIALPAISFDEESDPNSYLNQADFVYTENEFSDLLWNNQDLTLDGIVYVRGDVNIQGGQTLTINGVLVAEDDMKVGKNTTNCCWGTRCGLSSVTINQPSETAPAGLLAKGRIDLESCLGSLASESLIYANDQINLISAPGDLTVIGGLISRKLTLTSIWQGIDITYNNAIISYTLGDPTYSPIVTVDHWEEEY